MATQKAKSMLDIHEVETVKPTFTKEQILSSKKYRHRQDVVNVVLENDKIYTLSEVDILIENFMKGEVK